MSFLPVKSMTCIASADFDAFRKFHDDVYTAWRLWLTLLPTQDAADIPVLAAHLLCSPGDDASAAALASREYSDEFLRLR